jgi:hypothetical protein
MMEPGSDLLKSAQSAFHSTVRFAEPETIAAASRIMSNFEDLNSASSAIASEVAPKGRY